MRLVSAALIAAGLTALASASSVAATAPAKSVPKPAPAAKAVLVEAGALQALGRMSTYLRSNQAFEAKLTMQRDEVDAYGQVLTFNGETDYKVKAPNAFTIDIAEGQKTRKYIYDGKSVVVFDPRTSYYARFPGQPTIRATLEAAYDKFGITVPLDDLFRWGEGNQQSARLTAGHFVETTTVNGQAADHYAFRQPGVDWQIWIATGAKPVPLRVAIVASGDASRPRFQADLAWDTAPQFAADTFVFTPPAGAKSIPIAANTR
jgi:hypothetical protein